MDEPPKVANNTAAGCDNNDDTDGMTEEQTVSDFLCRLYFVPV